MYLLRLSQTACGAPFSWFAVDEFEEFLILFDACVPFPRNVPVQDHRAGVQYSERAVVKSAVGMLFVADQSVAPRDFKIGVRDE